ncbi:glycosyl transferase [Salmonella bongori]|nr:glycosyl transferase [Salmonella bongori]
MAWPAKVGRISRVVAIWQIYPGNQYDNRQPINLNLYAYLNRQQLAIRAIKSVLRQDYAHWEMIIVDDCSSAYEQLQQFVEGLNDPRVHYTHNESKYRCLRGAQSGYCTGTRALYYRY